MKVKHIPIKPTNIQLDIVTVCIPSLKFTIPVICNTTAKDIYIIMPNNPPKQPLIMLSIVISPYYLVEKTLE